MPYKIVVCRNDDDYEQFVRFFMDNRDEFLHSYNVKMAVHHIITSIKHGKILLFCNDHDEAVGLIVYSIGTPMNNYEDREIVYMSFILARSDYRQSRLFLHGMQRMAEEIEQIGVKEIRFRANAEDQYLRKLYGKLAKVVERKKYDHKDEGSRLLAYYDEEIYSMDYSHFARFVKKFVKK